MKIKFSLQRSAGPVDLMVTVDSATTIGELATYLLDADPAPGVRRQVQHPTLTIAGSGTLDARQPVAESPLRSGVAVTVSESGQAYAVAQRAAAAIVRVVEGPDAGKEFPIAAGSSIVGRERGVEVRLNDPMASRHHARINVGDSVEIIDLGSANGVLIDDMAVPRSIVRSADVVQLGDSKLSIRRLAGGHPADGSGGWVEFVRSPRVDPVYEGRTFEAPEPPERGRNQRFPLIALLAPILMGGLLYLITRSVTSIVFVALSPLMLIGTALESRLAGRSAYKRALKAFWAEVDDLVAEVEAEQQVEVGRRAGEHPSAAEASDAVRDTSPVLWTRRPGHRGYAEVRLGTGTLTSRIIVEYASAKHSTRALAAELGERTAALRTVDHVPVVGELSASALGVAGARPQALAVLRGLIVQLIGLHSPAELVLTALTSATSARDWDWLTWLPHTSPASSPIAGSHLSAGPTAGSALVSELEELLTTRQDADEPAGGPSVLLVIETDVSVQHRRLAALAKDGPAHGIFVLWLADEVAQLPAACETFVEITRDGTTASAGFVHLGETVTPVRLEQIEAGECLDLARRLSPVIDIDAQSDDASDLPRAVSLLALPGAELRVSPDTVIERWQENRSIVRGPLAPARPVKHVGTLRAVVGQSANEVHAIDLRSDGPHALVGGTTGAGKSELLQSWILAMAAAHSPQRLTFLLVDYKGGAAFKECEHLPHTVGLVTDLSPHLVRRALTSLSAELTYRERVLHQHSAKDLAELEKKGIADAPPSLVLVVDEFAALVTEVPEFVDGVVNIAQRGRSLGIHLILATQRPAGVIKDNLRANTNLRIALRMADEGDSSDVLGSPEAAFFDRAIPGRAVSKTGPGRLVPFQTGYAGGWTTEEPPPPDILVEELALTSSAVWTLPELEDVALVDPGPTDIARLVANVQQASVVAGMEPPRKPWLPELGEVYDLADRERVPSRRTDTELVFGVRDDPAHQSQPTMAFHPDANGNLAVYGTGGSGKSALLRTFAVAAGFTFHGGACHVYGIDFGNRGLGMLEALPHVGSIVAGADHERITRLLGWLRSTIDERALRYSRVNAATITDYRRLAHAPDEHRILLLVDGAPAFRQAYETADRLRWFDLFTSIAADGRPVGVHVILSADQRGGLPTSLQSAIQSRVVLRMANQDDYGMLGVPSDVLSAASPPGRGIMFDTEVQVAVLGGSRDAVMQSAAIDSFAESMRRSGVTEAMPIRSLPDRVLLTSLPSTVDDLPVLGIASSSLAPATLVPSGSFVLTGPPGSGRSNALLAFVRSLQRWRPHTALYYFGNRRSQLAGLDVWSATVLSADEASMAATDLTAAVSARGGAVAVVIEGVADFVNGLAESALQQLVKQVIADGGFVLAEGETTSFGSGIGLVGQLKGSRAGLVLAPDPGDGPTLLKTQFPKLSAAELPPGRGVLARKGRAEVVQLALVDQ